MQSPKDSPSTSSIICTDELEQLLDELLSVDKSKRDFAESRVQANLNNSSFLYSLIHYACTGNTTHASGTKVDSSPSTISSSDSSGSPGFSIGSPVHKKSLSGGDHAFVEEFDVRDTEETATPECAARRALAAVVSKSLVRNGWKDYADEDRCDIKEILVQHLVNLPTIVRPTIHLTVAAIAYRDTLPSGWSALITALRYQLDQCRGKHQTTAIAILDLLIIMANPDQLNETLANDLLNPDYGLQDGLIVLAQGMKQLNIARKQEVRFTFDYLNNLY